MATKLDTTRPIFLGANGARENTVVDHIRRAVVALNTDGAGVSYDALEQYMLQNYKPAKSQNYNSSFIKSYVRDAVNKYGFLTHDDVGNEYKVEAVAQTKSSTPKAKRVPKNTQEVLSVASFIIEAGEVEGTQDVDNTNITLEDIASELGKRKNWVEGRVEKGVELGYLRTAEEEGRTMVYVTSGGYAAAVTTPETDASEQVEESQPEQADA